MVTAISSIQYGAPELRRLAHRYAGVGLAVALMFHFSGIGAYWLLQNIGSDEEAPPREIDITTIGPPPSILGGNVPRVEVSSSMAKPSVGIPIPVPDARVSADKTIADQKDLSNLPGPASSADEDVKVTGALNPPSEDVAPPIFQPVEKLPEIIKQVLPVYPPLAIKAGLEGKVYVRIWVDKDGKPRKAVVVGTTAELFNQPAVDAAMQYRFTPAIMNKGPVAVWVVIPFAFRLKRQ